MADILGLPDRVTIRPLDGISLKPLFDRELAERRSAIGFRFQGKGALVDDRFKILTNNLRGGKFELYDVIDDSNESHDLSSEKPEIFAAMKQRLLDWNATVDASFAGKDYLEGKVSPPDPPSAPWYKAPPYYPFLTEWKDRWEYKSYLGAAREAKASSKRVREAKP